jgi:hypothetical protein
MAWAGVASGIVLFLAFRRFTDREAIRRWKRKRRAYVLGLYLFGDDPLLSLRGLARIARANAALLMHALPALVIAAPMVCAAAIYADRADARAWLDSGRGDVLTAQWSGACEPRLETPPWLRVDSPPVHAAAAGEISWRVRVAGKGSGAARAGCGGKWVSARLQSGQPGGLWLFWFGFIAWTTTLGLGLGQRLFRLFA